MDRRKALQFLASKIWDRGESKILGQMGIVPWYYRKKYETLKTRPDITEELQNVHDFLQEDLDATHYDLTWVVQGASVRVRIYCAECFGAAEVTPEMLVHEEVILLGEA